MKNYDNINVTAVAVVGAFSVVLLLALVFTVQSVYYSYEKAEETEKIVNVNYPESVNLIAEQEARLKRMGWIDRGNEKVSIPIERAMQLVVRDYNSDTEGADK